MTSTFSALDTAIFIGYAVLILGVGLWVSRDKKGHQKNAEDYFLASKSLPWWAVGALVFAKHVMPRGVLVFTFLNFETAASVQLLRAPEHHVPM